MRALMLMLLMLLLSPPRAHAEYCHSWLDPSGAQHEGFGCPEGFDPADATVCCGSCSLRYCCAATAARLDQSVCTNHREPQDGQFTAQPIYVPFLMVGSIFVAFVVVGSLVAVYCCTCLRPKQPAAPPMRFSLRSCQGESVPIILPGAPTSLRTPSRQSSSTATTTSSTSGSVRRFSLPGPPPPTLPPPPPPPYTQGGHTQLQLHPPQPSSYTYTQQYFSFPLQPDPFTAGKGFADFNQS